MESLAICEKEIERNNSMHKIKFTSKHFAVALLHIVLIYFPLSGFGQGNNLQKAESELAKLAIRILEGDSMVNKIEENRAFTKQLIETLKDPRSFDYPFEELKTISILGPEDRSFRIFTWHIIDANQSEYYGEQSYYYFGIVQRKISDERGERIVVIPLLELQKITRDIENRLLDNSSWLGMQYYPLRDEKFIPKYSIKIEDFERKDGKIVNPVPVETVRNYYLLTGWNGLDNRSNMKGVELMSFDPEDEERVIFGADVFFFEMIPKFRAVFRYSEIAPFTLNFAEVKTGPFKLFSKKMLVYDHLAPPRESRLNVMWEIGPDGSYDALNFYKKRGYFEWYRNIELDEPTNKRSFRELKEKQEQILRARLAELKTQAVAIGDQDLIKKIEKLEKDPNLGKKSARWLKQREKRAQKELQALQKSEQRKLQNAGIIK